MENLKQRLENIKTVERNVDVNKLGTDITNLLLKYASSTEIEDITTKEMLLVGALIKDIITNPNEYIK